MSRLIDADAIVKWYWDEFVDKHGFSPKETRFSINDIEMNLSNIPAANEWIPVSERLPENALDVLISDNIGHVEIGCCINGEWYDYNVDEYGAQDENFNLKVVAWQPLPKHYEVKEE